MSSVPVWCWARAAAGLAMISTCTPVSVGLGLPHHAGTATKSNHWLAARADILKAPVPTSVSGLLHQFSKSAFTTFWSTIELATEACAMADSNHPAALLNLTITV